MSNNNADNTQWSEADRRNALQNIFTEARGVKIDSSAILWYKLGYCMASFIEANISERDKLNTRHPHDPRESFEYLTRILSELEPIEDPDDIDLDKLLRELKAEIPDPDENISEEDIDQVIAELETEARTSSSIPTPTPTARDVDMHIKKNAKRYEETYFAICNHITKFCDKEIMQIDDYEEEGSWKYANPEEVKVEKQKLQAKIQVVADTKARELLGDDEFEKRCFNKWLAAFKDDSGLSGNDWKVPVE